MEETKVLVRYKKRKERRNHMRDGRMDWSDALSEQDIPAEVVNWESIITTRDDSSQDEVAYLDAEATIGEPSEADEDEDDH